ncbi:MAG: serine/threonine-protein kinase [Planctomycetaceae bacterium]
MEPHPRYQLLEKLASGSFATVYRGRDLELGREVAIKQIHEQYLSDPQQLDRYWQEAQLLASLQHPNIVTIYDVVRERGWLILELMQSDLSKIAGRRQMPLESLRTTLAHCLRALKFLHAHGIVHGDVKPSNMMVDRRRRVKLGDFGLARRVSDAEGSLIKGTTKYMAPEVVSDEYGEVGPASDLYSLGFAAFELMCGDNFESLFPGLNSFGRDRQMAWMMWHAAPDRRLPEIQRLLADVPEDLARTIQKLTAKPQAQRYKAADEALNDLNIDVKLVRTGEESVLGPTQPGLPDPRRRKKWIAIAAFATSAMVSIVALLWPTSGGPSGMPGGDQPVRGVVRAISPEEGKLVIEDEHGVPHEIVVGKQPRIRLNDEQYILLRELATHDRVELKPAAGDGAAPARITALRPVEGRGHIREVDPEGRRVVITLAADPHSEDVPMHVPEGAKLKLNGAQVELAGLCPDDRVEVRHLKHTSRKAARDVIQLDARRHMHLSGFLRDVRSQGEKSYLIVERHGEATPLLLAPDCRVEIDGQSSDGSRAYTASDLKAGDHLSVTYDTHVVSIEAERRHRYTGVLLKIDPAAREVVVRADDGRETAFLVGEECRISLDDHAAAIDQLQKYFKLELTYDDPGEGPPVALMIDARQPKS